MLFCTIIKDAFDLDGLRIIDEKAFHALHRNLCRKIKISVIEPNMRKWEQRLKLRKVDK